MAALPIAASHPCQAPARAGELTRLSLGLEGRGFARCCGSFGGCEHPLTAEATLVLLAPGQGVLAPILKQGQRRRDKPNPTALISPHEVLQVFICSLNTPLVFVLLDPPQYLAATCLWCSGDQLLLSQLAPHELVTPWSPLLAPTQCEGEQEPGSGVRCLRLLGGRFHDAFSSTSSVALILLISLHLWHGSFLCANALESHEIAAAG